MDRIKTRPVCRQIVPAALGRMMRDPDRAAARRANEAMLTTKNLDIASVERAFRGAAS